MSVQITEPIDGAILNKHDGKVTSRGLEVTVRGTCADGVRVTVNGKAAKVSGRQFTAVVGIDQRENTVQAQAEAGAHKITVLYDRNSFRRYRFSLDDDIWFLRDLAQQGCRSIFDHPYMALWRRLNRTYGTKVNCNIYYQCEGFNLSMMPDRYKGEWRDSAEWFRLTFHALQNEPDRPYINATYDQIAKDYDLIVGEILRLAGEEVMNTYTTIHWGEAPVEACRALRDRGIKGLCGYFIFDKAGKPAVSYYLDAAHTEHLSRRDYWKDTREDLIFIRHDIVVNCVKLPDIVAHLDAVAANPHQQEVMELMIHEQYFYPSYRAYIPEYAERCETAVRWVTAHGYQPVLYDEGFVGAPA